jgi:hypothetical protein
MATSVGAEKGERMAVAVRRKKADETEDGEMRQIEWLWSFSKKWMWWGAYGGSSGLFHLEDMNAALTAR